MVAVRHADFGQNNFTLLRLLLALMVVLGHFRLLAGVTHPEWPFGYASAAVDCFFAVSGYLVSASFDRDGNLKQFYVRRFFRIYPLYLAVVVAQTIVLGWLAPADADGGRSLLRYFLVNAVFANFLQYDVGSGVLAGLINPSLNPSLWTLKIEFGFYLLLPFLWNAVERRGNAVLVAVFAGSAAYYWGCSEAGHPELARQLPGQLQFFVLGVAAYRYRHRLAIDRGFGTVIVAALAVAMTVLADLRPPVIYPLIIGALVPLTALATPRIRWRRDISYGVYLLHGPTIQLSLLLGVYHSTWLGLLAIIALVIPAALVCERVVEAPGIAWGRRLGQWLERRERIVARAEPGAAPAKATTSQSRAEI